MPPYRGISFVAWPGWPRPSRPSGRSGRTPRRWFRFSTEHTTAVKSLRTTHCRKCWQPTSLLAKRCAQCGNVDLLRFGRGLLEVLAYVVAVGVAAVALAWWALSLGRPASVGSIFGERQFETAANSAGLRRQQDAGNRSAAERCLIHFRIIPVAPHDGMAIAAMEVNAITRQEPSCLSMRHPQPNPSAAGIHR